MRARALVEMHELLKHHMAQRRRLEELVEESHERLREGKIREAKRLYREATQIQDQLQAIETDFKRHRPGEKTSH